MKLKLVVIISALFLISSIVSNSALSSHIENVHPAQVTNRVMADVSGRWWSYTLEDNMSNVNFTWTRDWYFRLMNLDDESNESIINPKITVETPIELLGLWPNATIIGPPKYEWTGMEDIPENEFFWAGGSQKENATFRPRFSASRFVSPEELVENATIQNVLVNFTLEESLPIGTNEVSVLVFGNPIVGYDMQPLVNYSVLSYENLTTMEDWEAWPWGPYGVQWYTMAPENITLGKTYQFNVTFSVVKSDVLQGSPTSKPNVGVFWRRLDSKLISGSNNSHTIEHPSENLNVTFQADNELAWIRMISMNYSYFDLLPIVTGVVEQNGEYYTLSKLNFTLYSSADLHVYDPEGRHVGMNYDTGQEEIEIPGATYEHNGEQVISVPEPLSGDYRTVLVGTSNGTYELVIEGATDSQTFLNLNYTGWIETDEKKASEVTVPSVGRVVITRDQIVTVDEDTFHVVTKSTSGVSDIYFSEEQKKISFNVTGTLGTAGVCNVTIPDDLLWGEFWVYLDDLPLVENVNYTKTYNGTHYLFCLNYSHSSHEIQIIGTHVIPQFPSAIVPPLFMFFTLIAVALAKKIRRTKRATTT